MLHCKNSLSLLRDARCTTLPNRLILDAASLHLVREYLCAGFLRLRFVNVFHQYTLVLEDITLRLLVEGVIEMLVYLSRLTIFSEQSPKNSLPSHPKDLGRHTSLCGTLPLPNTSVPTLTLSGKEIGRASTRVDCCGLDDDATILDEFLYVRARVGIANL